MDWYVGTIDKFMTSYKITQDDLLRHYDPKAEKITFRGMEYELKPVYEEVKKVQRAANDLVAY